ncbi:MAG TPA: MarR family transcriptional regulator [Pseudonocardia sp.]|jgi:DNA-binding MarR family transcriptional regulator
MGSEADRLATQIGEFRRVALPGLLLQLTGGFAGMDLSLTQVATLYLLAVDAEHGNARTVRELAERIGRSVSATSRLVDQLVGAGLVDRREDPTDRRAKRLTLTEQGHRTLHNFERTRARAQLDVTRHLSSAEQRQIAEAMALLAQAARRLRDEDPEDSTAINTADGATDPPPG